uniref:Uncharacterized protein n=1 Tax=Rhizophora mucronata TaxID=61149 RepID=A0A2P2KR22_RHIMU
MRIAIPVKYIRDVVILEHLKCWLWVYGPVDEIMYVQGNYEKGFADNALPTF